MLEIKKDKTVSVPGSLQSRPLVLFRKEAVMNTCLKTKLNSSKKYEK